MRVNGRQVAAYGTVIARLGERIDINVQPPLIIILADVSGPDDPWPEEPTDVPENSIVQVIPISRSQPKTISRSDNDNLTTLIIADKHADLIQVTYTVTRRD